MDGMWTEDVNGIHSDSPEEAQEAFRQLQSQQQPPKKKGKQKSMSLEEYGKVLLKKAPHLKSVHGWRKFFADLNGGRDYNGINYDDDGNPTGFSIHKLEFPMYFEGPEGVLGAEETIAGYLVRSTSVVEGSAYIKTVSTLRNVGEGKGLYELVRVFEAEAKAQGASTIVIKGTMVIEDRLMNAEAASHLGYTFKKINETTFELIKSLK